MEIIILLLSYSIISSQRMFTFIKEADLYFLLTKEIAVVNQLKKSVIQSLLTILFQIFKFLTIYFFLFFISKNPTALFVILFVVILLSIAIKNYITWHEFYGKKIAFSPMLNSLVYIISIYLTLSKNYFLGLMLSIPYFLFFYFKLNYISEKNLNWNLILFYEQTSFSMFNKFLSNFLLIKESKLNISSPKYLNKILDLIPKNNDYLVAYIYFRRVLRVKDNRKELFSVPFIILFISISVSPSILSILIPLLIFMTTTITLSKKCSLRTFPMLIITKRHINRLIFCLVFLEFSLFIPIFFI